MRTTQTSAGAAHAELRVRDIMSATVLTAKPDDDVRLAEQMMLWGAFHHLPVVRDGALVGIVTERELSRKRPVKGRVQVDEVMVREVVTASPDEALANAATRMAADRISCLPVLDKGKLVGILTATDVLASEARGRLVPAPEPEPAPARPKVAEIMSKDPLTVTLSTPLTEAIGMMVEHSIRHLPVVDGQEAFVGMVSDRDIRTTVGDPVRALCDDAYGPAAELTVEDAMGTEPLVRVGPDEPLSVLAWGFVDQRVGAVAVTDEDDRVVGIVSYVDLLHRTLGDRTLGG